MATLETEKPGLANLTFERQRHPGRCLSPT